MWIKRITEADLEKVRRQAVAEATLAAQYAGLIKDFTEHQLECTHRYEKQEKAQAEMHVDNQNKFNKMNRIVWVATGATGAITWLTSTAMLIYEFFWRH